MLTSGMMASAKSDWETPAWLFRGLDDEFGFTLDVCANEMNAKCQHFIGPDRCGLATPWDGVCWMNPPYGRRIGRWVAKAHESARMGLATCVCLLPARTDTAWFHEHVMRSDEVRFIRGRLYFGGGSGRAPFPSSIVVFRAGEGPEIPLVRRMESRAHIHARTAR